MRSPEMFLAITRRWISELPSRMAKFSPGHPARPVSPLTRGYVCTLIRPEPLHPYFSGQL